MLPEEPLRWQRLAGALVAIGGVALICARLLSFNGWLAFLGGLGITVGAASAAFSNVLLKARKIELAPSMMAAWQMIFGIAPLLLFGLIDRRKSGAFHWTGGHSLPALSRDHRILAHFFAPLLADATNVGDEIANHLADHAAGRDRTRLGAWRRTVFGLVAAWRVLSFCSVSG